MSSALEYGIALETAGNLDKALDAYRLIEKTDEHYISACINIGTVLYNRGQLAESLKKYQEATELDDEYSLAWYNLANVLDRVDRDAEAVVAYEKAIALCPSYADAHYNLAVLFDALSDTRALRHYRTYLKYDSTSAWAGHARYRITAFNTRSGISLAFSNSAPERIEGRAALTLIDSLCTTRIVG